MWKRLNYSLTAAMSDSRFEWIANALTNSKPLRKSFSLTAFALLLLAVSFTETIRAQVGEGHTLFGDLKVEEGHQDGIKPISFDIILYGESGTIVARQSVTINGRYRFMSLRNGRYNLVVELENKEVARISVEISSPIKNDFRQDILMEWHSDSTDKNRARAGTISVADYYKRSSSNKKLFEKAQEAIDKKSYDQAINLLKQMLADDPKDFQGWTELGTVHLLQKNAAEAEASYLRAIEQKPTFMLALMNLGRLRIAQKDYQGAIEPLTEALKVQPQSASANYYLGEAYLQNKKGSMAVGYLNEALRLDPNGMAEAHLRLAALYNGAGMKDKAAAEYEQFLKKKPDYPDKKKLQQYIAENKKPSE